VRPAASASHLSCFADGLVTPSKPSSPSSAASLSTLSSRTSSRPAPTAGRGRWCSSRSACQLSCPSATRSSHTASSAAPRRWASITCLAAEDCAAILTLSNPKPPQLTCSGLSPPCQLHRRRHQLRSALPRAQAPSDLRHLWLEPPDLPLCGPRCRLPPLPVDRCRRLVAPRRQPGHVPGRRNLAAQTQVSPTGSLPVDDLSRPGFEMRSLYSTKSHR
jgi:hypothetical protein